MEQFSREVRVTTLGARYPLFDDDFDRKTVVRVAEHAERRENIEQSRAVRHRGLGDWLGDRVTAPSLTRGHLLQRVADDLKQSAAWQSVEAAK